VTLWQDIPMIDSLYELDPVQLVESLEALLPDGLESADDVVLRAIHREDVSEALREANRIYSERGASDVSAALQYAIILIHRELGEEAQGVISKALRMHADSVPLQLAQVDALLVRGELESAEALMEGIKSVALQDARWWGYLGDQFLDAERLEDAADCFESALEGGSEDPEMALRMAHLALERDDLEEAANWYERAGRLAPSSIEIWSSVADAWLGLGIYNRAAEAYERVLKLNEDDARAWMYLGIARAEMGELEDAVEAFREACDLNPGSESNWLNLAHTQLEIGLAEEARRSYEEAEDLDPTNPEALNGQVAAAYELGDIELAERLGKKALRIVPDNVDARFNLGIILLSLQRSDEAATMLRSIDDVAQGETRHLAPLALALLQQGDVEDAWQVAEELSKLVPDDAEPLVEFAIGLLRFASTDDLLRFTGGIGSTDPTWRAVVPVLELLAASLRRDEGFSNGHVERFVATVADHPEVVPVMVDFEELERFWPVVDDERRKLLKTMVAILEGRKGLDSLPSKVA
jgi:tetratricopeptide (TPR) repeat protein